MLVPPLSPMLLCAPAFPGQVSFPPHFLKSVLTPTLDLLSEVENQPQSD